ncbi:MAG TPA: NosD domain-containing protein [Candidatus Thermoplasmatota archaeon]|nr:NosD domain-containing protein [Candidatus Thermoplasmatota archaeon]
MWRTSVQITLIFLVIGLSLPTTAQNLEQRSFTLLPGEILYVGGSGPGNYTRIQDAIDNASNGDTVFIFPGTYYESILLDKALRIEGENQTTVILDSQSVFTHGILIQSSDTTVCNMTIQNYQSFTAGAGVIITDATLRHIIFTNLTLLNNWYGILAWNQSTNIQDIILSRTNLTGNTYGVRFVRTTHCRVAQCVFITNRVGLALDSSTNDTIQNNTFHENGLGLVGETLLHYIHTIHGNTVNGKPLIYLENQTHLTIDREAGQIIMVNCSYSTIRNITLNDTYFFGIYLAFGRHITIANCTLNRSALMLDKTHDDTVIDNTICHNQNQTGIGLAFADNNSILFNEFIHNDDKAVGFYSSHHNVLHSNAFHDNEIGIDFYSSSNLNTVYHNILSNNTQNALDECQNQWDNGSISGGNYWGDYTGNDTNQDGIGDTPYNIAGGTNQDRNPLILPYGMTSLTIGITPKPSRMQLSITNIGATTALNVHWLLTLKGGGLFCRRTYQGTTQPILPGHHAGLPRFFLIGFGPVELQASAWADNAPMVTEKTHGFLIIFYFFIR